MVDQVQIRLRETPLNIASHFIDDDGSIYLDIPEGFVYRRSKVIEEMDDLDKINFDRTVGFELDGTVKNMAILHNYLLIVDGKSTYDNLPVDFILDAEVDGSADLIIKREGRGKIEVIVGFEKYHWAKLIKGLYLKDVNLGTYTHTVKTVQELHDQFVYDGENHTWQPTVDYGGINSCGDDDDGNLLIPQSMERPLFSPKHILERVFCHIGWKFESPILNHEIGKRIWMYLLDSNFGTSSAEASSLSAIARTSVDSEERSLTTGWRTLPFPVVVDDPNGRIVSVSTLVPNLPQGLVDAAFPGGVYVGNGQVSINAIVRCRITDLDDDQEVQVRMIKYNWASSREDDFVILDEKSISRETKDDSEAEEFELSAEGVCCFEYQYVQVQIRVTGKTGKYIILRDSVLTYIGERNYFEEDREYVVSQIIDQSYEAEKMFKGLTAALGWKFDTDPIRRVVTAYSPYDFVVRGEGVEGYYKTDSIIDFDNKIVSGSIDTVYPDKTGRRYHRLQWADTTDPAIEETNPTIPILSRTFDRGPDYFDSRTKEIKNPFFEPTISGPVAALRERVPFGSGLYLSNEFIYGRKITPHYYEQQKSMPLQVPIIRGGDDVEHTWEIGPRIMLSYGVVKQGLKFPPIDIFGTGDVSEFDFRSINRSGNISQLIPTAHHDPGYISHPSNDINGVTRWPDDALTYLLFVLWFGPDSGGFSLYEMIHKRAVVENNQEIEISLLANLTEEDFRSLDKRSLYQIQVNGKPRLFKLKTARDFEYFGNIPTPVEFQAFSEDTQACGITSAESSSCVNVRRVSYQILGSTIELEVNGSGNATVTGTQWFMQINGSSSVQTIPNQSLVTAQLQNQTQTFDVWSIVSHGNNPDGEPCADITTPRVTINPCITDQPELDVSGYINEEGEQCVEVAVAGGIQNPYTVIDSNYIPVAGGSLSGFILADPICGIEEDIEIIVNIDFEDACGPVELRTIVNFPLVGVSVEDPTASVEIVNEGFNSFTFNRIGPMPIGEYEDYIIYRTDENGTYRRWNEKEAVASDYIGAKRVLIAVNNPANNYASEEVIK